VHELSIAAEVYRTSRSAVAEHGGGRLVAVRLAVGELTAIEPELLGFAWEALLARSGDAGARLDVEWRPARQHCAVCGGEKLRGEGTWLRLCPDCGQPLAVEGGDELDVLSVEFEQDGEKGHD
jgi:hydrogenase nickel incorporation protein HypA/HybF